uniref:Uncharacterized protein n=1 Tax=Magallana gigas TaxID=29159 RepID=K1PRP2_MAGGI
METNIFKIIVLVCIISTTGPANVGESCDRTRSCAPDKETCNGGICNCSTGYINVGGKCETRFDSKSVSVTGLEEYWPYRFKVIAATGKGNSTSDFSSTFRTKSGLIADIKEMRRTLFSNIPRTSSCPVFEARNE